MTWASTAGADQGLFEFERKLFWDTIDKLGGTKGMCILFTGLMIFYAALIFMLPYRRAQFRAEVRQKIQEKQEREKKALGKNS